MFVFIFNKVVLKDAQTEWGARRFYLFILVVFFSFFRTSLMNISVITVRALALTLSLRALFLTAERERDRLFSHAFLFLILQVASYKKHKQCLITAGCSPSPMTPIARVLHTMLNRPGTRSNRFGPDPDPADHLKYRPEPVRVPGRRVSGAL